MNTGAAAEPVAPAAHPRPQEMVLAEALCTAMADIHRRSWCEGTGGNFSCVLSRDPLELLMAPSGVDKGSVAPPDLIVVDGKGEVIRGSGRASAETPLHLTIVTRAGAGAVLHTHSQAATLLSRLPLEASAQGEQRDDQQKPPQGTMPPTVIASIEFHGLEMLKGLEGITTHATTVAVPVLANDQDLERLSARAAEVLASPPWGLLLAGHGLYAWGRDLQLARRHLEILEFLLEQRWREELLQALRRSPLPEQRSVGSEL